MQPNEISQEYPEAQILDGFLNDFLLFLQKYYTENITEITKEKGEHGSIIKITGPEDSLLRIENDGDEIGIYFDLSHWHVSCLPTQIDCNEIIARAIEDVIDVLRGWRITYTLWDEHQRRGGGEVNLTDDDVKESAIKAAGSYFKGAKKRRVKRWAEAAEEFPVEM